VIRTGVSGKGELTPAIRTIRSFERMKVWFVSASQGLPVVPVPVGVSAGGDSAAW
jgi:hypothetical protein